MDDQRTPAPGAVAALAGRDYGEVLWEPTPESIAAARVTGYARWLAANRGLHLAGHDQLWQWSVTDPAAFWESVWDYFGVLGDRGSGPALSGGTMPGVRWFDGATTQLRAQRAADRPRTSLAGPRWSTAARTAAAGRSATESWSARWPGQRPGCAGSASPRATASPATCLTSRRR